MIYDCNQSKCRTIANNGLSITLSESKGLRLNDIKHLHADLSWLAEPCELFQLKVLDKVCSSSDFFIVKAQTIRDMTGEYLIYDMQIDMGFQIISRIGISTEEDQGLMLLMQFGVDWKNQSPQEIYLHIPLFKYFGKKENQWYLSSNPLSRPDGAPVMHLHDSVDLPICNIAADQHTGFSFEMRDIDQFGAGWNQMRNCDLLHMTDIKQLLDNSMLIRQQNKVVADIMEFRIYAVDQGWPEAFLRWKKRVRSQMDLTMYERPDLQWYRKNLYQHFTFAYSKEVFDYEKQCFDPEKLIQAGKEFGGYDSVLLWFVYPRLGVDERTQWDFTHDIPRGTKGIRDFVRKCHENGVRAFLPYNPWDEKVDVSPVQTAEYLCDLIRETEIDGIWLDTMDRMPDDFRKKVDEIRPGVVFCLECYPATRHMLEIVTGHWDQFFDKTVMPQSNILRYVFPENNAPITSRWKVGAGKDQFIKRAIFNGTGIAIWQDVFGAWLPFSQEEKLLMKKWKALLLEHSDTFFGKDPVPMYPVLQKELYANRFMNDDRSETIYTVYNASNKIIDGELLNISESGQPVELLNGTALINQAGILQGGINPNEVLVIAVAE